MPHGGERTPDKPAPVSGPGKLSRRTDGGPGKRLEFGDYDSGQVGEAQRLAAMQAAAPQAGRQSGVAGPPTRAQAGLSPVEDPFGPSARPGEDVTAGIDQSEDPVIPEDPYTFLRALYARHPHPDLLRLLQRAAEKQARRGSSSRESRPPQPGTSTGTVPPGPQASGRMNPVAGNQPR